jgi:hypothetical protein
MQIIQGVLRVWKRQLQRDRVLLLGPRGCLSSERALLNIESDVLRAGLAMGKPCTGGGRGIGKLGRVWNVKPGVELSWEVIGEGQTRRFFFLDIKVEWLVLCRCRGCRIIWCVAYGIY